MQVTEMLNHSGQANLLFVETCLIGAVHGYVRTRSSIKTQSKLA